MHKKCRVFGKPFSIFMANCVWWFILLNACVCILQLKHSNSGEGKKQQNVNNWIRNVIGTSQTDSLNANVKRRKKTNIEKERERKSWRFSSSASLNCHSKMWMFVDNTLFLYFCPHTFSISIPVKRIAHIVSLLLFDCDTYNFSMCKHFQMLSVSLSLTHTHNPNRIRLIRPYVWIYIELKCDIINRILETSIAI